MTPTKIIKLVTREQAPIVLNSQTADQTEITTTMDGSPASKRSVRRLFKRFFHRRKDSGYESGEPEVSEFHSHTEIASPQQSHVEYTGREDDDVFGITTQTTDDKTQLERAVVNHTAPVHYVVQDIKSVNDEQERTRDLENTPVRFLPDASVDRNALKAPLHLTQPRTPKRPRIVTTPCVVDGKSAPPVRDPICNSTPTSFGDGGSPTSKTASHLPRVPAKEERYRRLKSEPENTLQVFRLKDGKRSKHHGGVLQVTLENALRRLAYKALDDPRSMESVYRILRRQKNMEDHETQISGFAESFQPRDLNDIETRWLERAAYAHVVLSLVEDGQLNEDHAADIITQLLPLRRHSIVGRDKFALFLGRFDMGAGDREKLLSLQTTPLEFSGSSAQTLVPPPKYVQEFVTLPKSGLYHMEPTRSLRGYELLRLVEAACYNRKEWEGFRYSDPVATVLQYYEAFDKRLKGETLTEEQRPFRRNWNSVERDYLRRAKFIIDLHERANAGTISIDMFLKIRKALMPVGMQYFIDSHQLSKYLYDTVFDTDAKCGLDINEIPHILILHEDNRDKVRYGASEQEVLADLHDQRLLRINEEAARISEQKALQKSIDIDAARDLAVAMDKKESSKQRSQRLKDYTSLNLTPEERLTKWHQDGEAKQSHYRKMIKQEEIEAEKTTQEELEWEIMEAEAAAKARMVKNELMREERERSSLPWWKLAFLDTCAFSKAKLGRFLP